MLMVKPIRQVISLVCNDQWLAMVDDWRKRQPNLPNRSQAILQLVLKGLKNKDA